MVFKKDKKWYLPLLFLLIVAGLRADWKQNLRDGWKKFVHAIDPKTTSQKISNASDMLTRSANDLSNAPTELRAGVDKLADIPKQLEDGMKKVTSGIDKIHEGQRKIETQRGSISKLDLAHKGLKSVEDDIYKALDALNSALKDLANPTSCQTPPPGILCDLSATMSETKRNITGSTEAIRIQIDSIDHNIQSENIPGKLNSLAKFIRGFKT